MLVRYWLLESILTRNSQIILLAHVKLSKLMKMTMVHLPLLLKIPVLAK